MPGEGPWLVGPAGRGGVGGGHLHPRPGPEPPVHRHRLQVLPVAALEVAEAARGPDVGQVALAQELPDELLLGGRLQGHQVHAVLPADVPPVQPINLDIASILYWRYSTAAVMVSRVPPMTAKNLPKNTKSSRAENSTHHKMCLPNY